MSTHRFYQLDVFTHEALTGNALAVFPHADGLTSIQMQRLAREMNLSETTFVLPSEEATRRVRIFTPTAEIPLAGHPTIGTWWLLAAIGEMRLPDIGVHEITQETGAGILPVFIHVAGSRPIRVVMVQTLPEYLATYEDRARLGRALGGDESSVADGPPPQVVSTALPQLMVPASSREALSALPSGGAGADLVNALREVGTDCVMCYWLDPDAPEPTAHCRMFAPGLGVPEDPATGSAAGALGAYLVHHGLLPTNGGTGALDIRQGAEIDRPSKIHVEIDVNTEGQITQVRVGGEAVIVMKGEVDL